MQNQPNNLIHASSPYLLQHAYNPVEWFEWGTAALQKAQLENKLILVSIGYSACHWCHVMERECFENYEVAEIMNKHFVCIKVDREERPDIDQIYMYAVQLMTGAGGWPLNCICLPDQRPIYGGTYFKPNDWINILENVAALWANDADKAIKYAERLTAGIKESEIIKPVATPANFQMQHLLDLIEPWKRHFDISLGGYTRAPKFPLPNNWLFLMRYGFLAKDKAVHTATTHTLEQMAWGGIYDQIGGGFARYAVDDKWHVPHFEKMLYDNAQLIELYVEAYQYLKNDEFKQIAIETIDWAKREMLSKEGLFFSALDADSEGVEGKFYTWNKEEFDQLLGTDAALMAAYFNVTEEGNWEEEEVNILRRLQSDLAITEKFNISQDLLSEKVYAAKQVLLNARAARVRPGLDDKCLTAWNAMMIKALSKAGGILSDSSYYLMAQKAMNFILENLKTADGGLFRNYKDGKASIEAFLDDYAFLIDALISLYEFDFNENWLLEAKSFADFVLENFEDSQSPMLFYTAIKGESLIARKHEVMDNVISSSNSVMAKNLQKLALFLDHEGYAKKALEMLNAVLPKIKSYGSAYSNWSIQLLNEIYGINEIAIVGLNANELHSELNNLYIPNKITLGGTKSNLPLLKGKESFETKVYICRNKVCQLPVSTVEEALRYLQ